MDDTISQFIFEEMKLRLARFLKSEFNKCLNKQIQSQVIDSKERYIQDLHAKISTMEDYIKSLKETIDEKDKDVKNLEITLKVKEEEISKLQNTVESIRKKRINT